MKIMLCFSHLSWSNWGSYYTVVKDSLVISAYTYGYPNDLGIVLFYVLDQVSGEYILASNITGSINSECGFIVQNSPNFLVVFQVGTALVFQYNASSVSRWSAFSTNFAISNWLSFQLMPYHDIMLVYLQTPTVNATSMTYLYLNGTYSTQSVGGNWSIHQYFKLIQVFLFSCMPPHTMNLEYLFLMGRMSSI